MDKLQFFIFILLPILIYSQTIPPNAIALVNTYASNIAFTSSTTVSIGYATAGVFSSSVGCLLSPANAFLMFVFPLSVTVYEIQVEGAPGPGVSSLLAQYTLAYSVDGVTYVNTSSRITNMVDTVTVDSFILPTPINAQYFKFIGLLPGTIGAQNPSFIGLRVELIGTDGRAIQTPPLNFPTNLYPLVLNNVANPVNIQAVGVTNSNFPASQVISSGVGCVLTSSSTSYLQLNYNQTVSVYEVQVYGAVVPNDYIYNEQYTLNYSIDGITYLSLPPRNTNLLSASQVDFYFLPSIIQATHFRFINMIPYFKNPAYIGIRVELIGITTPSIISLVNSTGIANMAAVLYPGGAFGSTPSQGFLSSTGCILATASNAYFQLAFPGPVTVNTILVQSAGSFFITQYTLMFSLDGSNFYSLNPRNTSITNSSYIDTFVLSAPIVGTFFKFANLLNPGGFVGLRVEFLGTINNINIQPPSNFPVNITSLVTGHESSLIFSSAGVLNSYVASQGSFNGIGCVFSDNGFFQIQFPSPVIVYEIQMKGSTNAGPNFIVNQQYTLQYSNDGIHYTSLPVHSSNLSTSASLDVYYLSSPIQAIYFQFSNIGVTAYVGVRVDLLGFNKTIAPFSSSQTPYSSSQPPFSSSQLPFSSSLPPFSSSQVPFSSSQTPQFSSSATNSALFCAVGSYINQTSCILCSLGKFTNTNSSTICLLCNVGQFTSMNGSSTCTACVAGTFSPISGATSCILCPPGAYSSSNGTTSCLTCQPGTFSNTTGLTLCYNCPVGTFQNNSNSVSCLPNPTIIPTTILPTTIAATTVIPTTVAHTTVIPTTVTPTTVIPTTVTPTTITTTTNSPTTVPTTPLFTTTNPLESITIAIHLQTTSLSVIGHAASFQDTTSIGKKNYEIFFYFFFSKNSLSLLPKKTLRKKF